MSCTQSQWGAAGSGRAEAAAETPFKRVRPCDPSWLTGVASSCPVLRQAWAAAGTCFWA